MADDKSPNRTPNARLRTENDTKPEPVQTKATPRVPNTPHASDSSIPGPGAGHRTIRPEGCLIPMLDRSRNRERVLEQREQREQRERESKVDRKVDLVISDTSRSSSPAERHKMKLAKPTIRLPGDQQNKSFVYLCKPVKKVKELLTARRLRHSCEHLELAGFGEDKVESQLQKTNSEALLHSKAVEQGLELSSITEMSLTSTSSSASQLQLSLPHRQLLQEEPPMGCNQERLESQLTEVRQRQRYLCQKEQREKEMDLVCQNLPTLQHEIRLLQELSEKLETTLRVSNVSKQKSNGNGSSYDLDRQSSTIFYTPRTGPMLFEEQPLVRMGYVRKEQLAKISQRAGMVATVLNVGVVREFRIENKTLNELKSTDESQCFYLPAPSAQPARQEHLAIRDVAEGNPPPLQCTNIRMLRENPGVLLQQLRRGSGGGGGSSFNIIDHDMFMFLNSLAKKSSEGDYLYSRLSVAKELSPGYQAAYLQPQELELPAKRSREQVNSTTQTEEPVPKKAKLEILHPPEANSPHIPDLVQTTKPTKKEIRKLQQQQQQPLPLLRTTRKARIIKTSPIQSNVEPKVRMKLFKTVLVGLVQVAIFLVLIMAFIYPDVSC